MLTYLLTLERLMWFITAQCQVMKEPQTLILKQQSIGWCLCKEALESVDSTFTAKTHSIVNSQEGVVIGLVEPSYGLHDIL